MNSKGQISNPVLFFLIAAGFLFLLGPIFMKVFLTIDNQFGGALGNVSSGGNISQANFHAVMNTTINFWDGIIVIAFVASVVLLFISAFLIDTSPFWVFLYIILSFLLVIFAPNILQGIDNLYTSSTFSAEMTHLTWVSWLETNFMFVLVGLIVVTGIIIYGKVALANNIRGGTRR